MADTLVARDTIPAQTVISAADVALSTQNQEGALQDARAAIGRQTRKAIFAGQALFAQDLQEPLIIRRNTLINIIYVEKSLRIETTGRALENGNTGAMIRAMNLRSKTIVNGIVAADGQVYLLERP